MIVLRLETRRSSELDTRSSMYHLVGIHLEEIIVKVEASVDLGGRSRETCATLRAPSKLPTESSREQMVVMLLQGGAERDRAQESVLLNRSSLTGP